MHYISHADDRCLLLLYGFITARFVGDTCVLFIIWSVRCETHVNARVMLGGGFCCCCVPRGSNQSRFGVAGRCLLVLLDTINNQLGA